MVLLRTWTASNCRGCGQMRWSFRARITVRLRCYLRENVRPFADTFKAGKPAKSRLGGSSNQKTVDTLPMPKR
jgi:hypothetical protein